MTALKRNAKGEVMPAPQHVNPGMDTTINPIIINDSFRQQEFKGNTKQYELVEVYEKHGWKFLMLVFVTSYTCFSIFLATYLWVLSNIFGFKIVGCVMGWCP